VNLVQSSNSGGGGLIGAAIAAAVEQMLDTVSDQTHNLARMANQQLIYDKNRGMFTGPLHPEFGQVDGN